MSKVILQPSLCTVWMCVMIHTFNNCWESLCFKDSLWHSEKIVKTKQSRLTQLIASIHSLLHSDEKESRTVPVSVIIANDVCLSLWMFVTVFFFLLHLHNIISTIITTSLSLLLSLSSFFFFFSTSFPPLYQHHYHDCYSHHHHYFIIITIIITIIIISTIITVVNIFKSFPLGVKHLTEQPVVKGSTCLPALSYNLFEPRLPKSHNFITSSCRLW